MTAFYISAAHKSSGKTMLSMGLSAALRARGLAVQTFKKGPDYIDPIWLGLASAKPCHNLDFYTSSSDFIQSQYHYYAGQQDVVLVEGNKGLHDGVAVDGSDSNAALAKLLKLPVVLVIDTVGITRGIAPLLCGYQAFDTEVDIAGVILNKVGGDRHAGKLINAIEQYTDIPILGAVHRDKPLELCERHLGLVPGNEFGDQAEAFVELWQHRVHDSVDLDKILSLTTEASQHCNFKFNQQPRQADLRIAIARDAVFGFYYPADLDRFAALGVSLVSFDTTTDQRLPEDIDGLFIGGGFPETNLNPISSNKSLLSDIKDKIESGLPAYAECGGLMYLCRSIRYGNQNKPMAGVIAADVVMHDKPQGRGYVDLAPTGHHPWCSNFATPEIQAHEFHYSSLVNHDKSFNYAYQVNRGHGIDGRNDGIMLHNLLASYSHLRHTDACPWVDQFVNFIGSCKTVTGNGYNQQERCHSN
ncbi:MAG: cobyrinate a,c-diamide synthase [Gammaproteobacteria bacterium]|nr:cobyrinate a,c-diamide synthase [Gammaproteobacteria bacterium]